MKIEEIRNLIDADLWDRQGQAYVRDCDDLQEACRKLLAVADAARAANKAMESSNTLAQTYKWDYVGLVSKALADLEADE